MGRAATVAGLLLTASSVLAGTPAPPVVLQWSAPPDECPDAAYVLAEVRRLIGDEPTSVTVAAKAKVTHLGEAKWRVELTTLVGADPSSVGRRTLDATSCRSLADATALLIALVVSPDRVGAPKAPPAPPAVPPKPPPVLATPVVQPVAIVQPVPPVVVDVPRAAPPRPRSAPWLGVSIAAALTYGVYPAITPGIALGLDARVGRFRASLFGVVDRSQRAAVLGGVDEGGTFAGHTLGLRVGFSWLDSSSSLEFVSALVGTWTRVEAEGFGAPTTTSAVKHQGGLGPGLALATRLVGPLFARLQLDLLVPLRRYAYEIGGGEIHTVGPLLAITQLGVEARF